MSETENRPLDDQELPTPEEAAAMAAEAMRAEEPEAQETPAAEENPLQTALDAATAKADEYLALAQRVQADFDNFRRRNESVRADSFAEGQRSAVTAMLDVRDNLERAVPLAEEGTPLQAGLVLTLKNLSAAFEKLGVKEISREGEKFDPNLENAVMQGSPEEGEPGTVCAVFQKGYEMGGRVLRHALVKVVSE